MSTPIEAVLLDIDDTLLDTTSAMIAAGEVGMAALWPDRDSRWHRDASVRFRTDPDGFFTRYTQGDLTFDAMRSARLGAVAKAFGCPLPPDALAVYESAYRPAFDEAQHVFADVRPFLDRCAEAGLPVGALTNSAREATDRKLAVTGTTDWYAVVVTRDDLGFGKPDPRIFLRACELLGAPAAGTAYVGDEFRTDVLGASETGLRPVWVRREGSAPLEHRPHHGGEESQLPPGTLVVPDLTSLPGALDLGSSGEGR